MNDLLSHLEQGIVSYKKEYVNGYCWNKYFSFKEIR